MTESAGCMARLSPGSLALTRLARASAHSPPSPGLREREGARAAQRRGKGEGDHHRDRILSTHPSRPVAFGSMVGVRTAGAPVQPAAVLAGRGGRYLLVG